jgi:hypothetical protein
VPTDATSTACYDVAVGAPGTWTFTATWAGNGSYSGSTGTCMVAVQAPSNLSLAAGPVTVGSAAVTTGSLTPAANGTPVTITYVGPGGAGGTDNVITDSSGNFSDQFIFSASGSWTVTATFAGDATRQPQTASCPLTVSGL